MFVPATSFYITCHTPYFYNTHSVFQWNIAMCLMLFKIWMPYFTFYFILNYIWTNHGSDIWASCFLSREWQITPSGSQSLWSRLHVAATIIPCTTFQHIPFASQFVQPGIIATPLNPLLQAPILLHPSGSIHAWPFLPSPGKHFVFCFVLCVCFFFLILAKEQSANHESSLLPMKPPTKLYQDVVDAHYGHSH